MPEVSELSYTRLYMYYMYIYRIVSAREDYANKKNTIFGTYFFLLVSKITNIGISWNGWYFFKYFIRAVVVSRLKCLIKESIRDSFMVGSSHHYCASIYRIFNQYKKILRLTTLL